MSTELDWDGMTDSCCRRPCVTVRLCFKLSFSADKQSTRFSESVTPWCKKKKHTKKVTAGLEKVSDETTQINCWSWIILRLSGLVFNVLSFKCRALEQILPKAYRCNSEFGQLLFSFFNTALQLINLQGENQCCQFSKSGKKKWVKGVKLN